MAETQILRQDPDGSRGLESAAQFIGRVVLAVGDDRLTIPEALMIRPTQQDVAQALADALGTSETPSQQIADLIDALARVRETLTEVSERMRVLSLSRDPLPSDLEPNILRAVRNTATGRIGLWVSDGTTVTDLLDLSLA